ncbi:hypothetical protein [Tardiphaga sp. 768_D3_N2_1]|uniref:hypothetical protein n=1 Tax=Tardiphaga sp. 768_D3_N2_1 TaxID=3240783 RepID=UPI003F8AD6B1
MIGQAARAGTQGADGNEDASRKYPNAEAHHLSDRTHDGSPAKRIGLRAMAVDSDRAICGTVERVRLGRRYLTRLKGGTDVLHIALHMFAAEEAVWVGSKRTLEEIGYSGAR